MNKSIALICACMALSIVVVGCGDDEDSGGNAATEPAATTEQTQGENGKATAETSVAVDMKDTEYVPQDVTVAKGGTITWTNSDPYAHTVTKENGPGIQFDSGDITQGSTFKQKFDVPGTVDYVCTIHPNQTGTVTVK
jgi:plastocyanin